MVSYNENFFFSYSPDPNEVKILVHKDLLGMEELEIRKLIKDQKQKMFNQ